MAARRCGSDAGGHAWPAPAWATGGCGHRVDPPGSGGTVALSCHEPADRGTPRPASGKWGEREKRGKGGGGGRREERRRKGILTGGTEPRARFTTSTHIA